MNTSRHSFFGYRHHPLAEATRPDGGPLRLAFRTSPRIRTHEDISEAAFAVGNRQDADGNGQTWPADICSVSVGDVVKVNGPDHWIVYLNVDSVGFSAVPEPTTLVNLTGTCATSRH
ncbi:hypothetical protein [Streptomyces luteireticuli]|uniref:hypothetical protein n=1 Tax=Streptomyces luteireticuli TaxID=173858 RepID=UPI0035569ECC